MQRKPQLIKYLRKVYMFHFFMPPCMVNTLIEID